MVYQDKNKERNKKKIGYLMNQTICQAKGL